MSDHAICPVCGDEFDSEHGMKVHKGKVHDDEGEAHRITLTEAAFRINEAVERVTGKKPLATEEFVDRDPTELAGLIEVESEQLETELDDRLPEGYHPGTTDADYFD